MALQYSNLRLYACDKYLRNGELKPKGSRNVLLRVLRRHVLRQAHAPVRAFKRRQDQSITAAAMVRCTTDSDMAAVDQQRVKSREHKSRQTISKSEASSGERARARCAIDTSSNKETGVTRNNRKAEISRQDTEVP